jgi:GTP-binding protein
MPFNPVLKAEYITSSKDLAGCPVPDRPEYAFLGRSNVGKSSLINMITGKRAVARTSSTPGKTRLINHFLIEDSWYLVDLPGFGYARSAKSARAEWDKMIRSYLQGRKNLMCNFLLIDARLEMQEIDRTWINYHGENALPFALVFTKIDKLSQAVLKKNLEVYKKKLLTEWVELPPVFITSAVTGVGREDILSYISETNTVYDGLIT